MLQKYSVNPQQLSTILFLISTILRNSPQLFYNNDKQENSHIYFIYSLIDMPLSMTIILISISMILLIVSIAFVILGKIKTYYFQIFYYILAPISVVLIKRLLINLWQSGNVLEILCYGICEILVIVFLVVYPILQFRIKTARTQTINRISSSYCLVGNISFFIMTFTPVFDIDDNIIFALLFGMYLTRSCMVLLKISFQSLQIQYASLLGEMHSWIGVILLAMRINLNMEITLMCWFNLFMVIYLAYYPSNSLVSILQVKYNRALLKFKQRFIDDLNIDGDGDDDDDRKENTNHMYDEREQNKQSQYVWHYHNRNKEVAKQIQLIEIFCCMLAFVQGKQQQQNHKDYDNYDSTNKIRFSSYFNSQVIEVIRLMSKSNCQNDLFSNFNFKQHNNNKIQKCENSQQYQNRKTQQIRNQNILWKIINHLNQQLQKDNYTNLRRLVIYNMPITNNLHYYKLLRLYYLNVCQQKYEKKGLALQYWKIVDYMMYQYLSQGLLMGLEVRERQWRTRGQEGRVLGYGWGEENQNDQIVNNIRNEQQQQKKNLMQNNCFHTRASMPPLYQETLTHFDLYYQQTQTQQHLLTKFHSIQTINLKLIQQVRSKRDDSNKKVLQILIEKNGLKNQIRQRISQLEGRSYHSVKGVLFRFVYQYCVENRPYVAVNNFLLSDFINYDSSEDNNNNNYGNRNRKMTKRTLLNQKLKLTKTNKKINDYQSNKITNTQNNNNNNNNRSKKMLVYISGIQKFGRIVHCCEQFRQTMDLQKLTNLNTFSSKDNNNNLMINNNERLSIYDIMLPLWVDKHVQMTKNIISLNNQNFIHTSNKVHLMSTHQKRIYQCNITMYPIIRNTDDLLFAMDITYRQLSKLTIYRNQRQVFHSLSSKYTNSRTSFIKSRKIIRKDQEQGQQSNDKSRNNCVKYKQMIFGQQYVVERRYKKQKQGREMKKRKDEGNLQKRDMKNNSKTNRAKILSRKNNCQQQTTSIADNNTINPQTKSIASSSLYEQKHQQLQTGMSNSNTNTLSVLSRSSQYQKQNLFFNQRLKQEIKVNQYIKNTLFHKTKLLMFSLMHWTIPPTILSACLFLRYYSGECQKVSDNITETKINLYQKFLLVDTHMLSQLYYLNMLYQNKNDLQFHTSNNSVISFMLEDIKYTYDFIKIRKEHLYKQLSSSKQLLTMFLQDDQSIGSTSVYFTQLIFGLQTEDYLQNIGFDVDKNYDASYNSLNYIYKDKKVTIDANRFFKKFKHRYQRYFEEINSLAILPTLSQLQIQTYEYSQTHFFICLVALIGMSLMTSLIFVFLYLDLEFHVQKLVLKCLDLPDQVMKKVFSSINQLKNLLQNCKDNNYPSKIIQKLHFNSHSNEIESSFHSTKTKEIFLSRVFTKKYHHKTKHYDSIKRVFWNKFPIIIVFFVILIVLQTFLAFLIIELQSGIQTSKNFSSGVQKLTGLVSLSNEIVMQIFLKFDNASITNVVETKQHEFYHLEKLNFISSIELNHEKYLQLVFSDICNLKDNLKNETICPNYNKKTAFSYAEVVASTYKVFKKIEEQLNKIKSLQKHQQFTQINLHFSKLIKYLSLLNRYAHQMVNIGRRNLQQNKGNPQIFFYLIILQMIFVVFSFNWFTYDKMYKAMKIYQEQAFKVCPLHQFQAHRDMEFYFNQAKQQKINYVSGHYKINA